MATVCVVCKVTARENGFIYSNKQGVANFEELNDAIGLECQYF